MGNSPFLYLTYNVALLLALAVLFDTAGYRQRVTLTYWRQVIVGLFIGGIGIAIMLTPWTYSAGIVFDTRSVLLGISGLFFGLIPTLIAMVMTAALRISMGGAATLTGVSVIIATSMLGIAWRYLRRDLYLT